MELLAADATVKETARGIWEEQLAHVAPSVLANVETRGYEAERLAGDLFASIRTDEALSLAQP